MNRRRAAKVIALGVLGVPAARARGLEPVKVADLDAFAEPWSHKEFVFDALRCVATRVEPQPDNPRVLNLRRGGVQSAFSAYSLICTHAGCIVRPPDAERLLDCPCHGSLFQAQDGAVRSGPARRPLRAVRLEVRGGELWAAGWLED